MTNNPWIEIELTEPEVMSGLALVQYGSCEKHWNNVQIRAANESTSLQPADWTDDPETHGNLALIMNKVIGYSFKILDKLKSKSSGKL